MLCLLFIERVTWRFHAILLTGHSETTLAIFRAWGKFEYQMLTKHYLFDDENCSWIQHVRITFSKGLNSKIGWIELRIAGLCCHLFPKSEPRRLLSKVKRMLKGKRFLSWDASRYRTQAITKLIFLLVKVVWSMDGKFLGTSKKSIEPLVGYIFRIFPNRLIQRASKT